MRDYTLDERKYINWLYHVPGLGRKRMGVILSSGVSPYEICAGSAEAVNALLMKNCGFSQKESSSLSVQIAGRKGSISPDELWEEMRSKDISFLLPQDAGYPQRLKNIPDAPFALYMKGCSRAAVNMSQKKPVVAVIGARECSEYGKYIATQLGECAARFGAALVSGMAYGVDGISQRAAMQEGGLVAAVLGCGCDICYPASNRSVYECLLHNGCVFSEYVPGTEPKANYFPPRNRIISGMADALIVVEAKEKSGTLITVDMALEQGKDVYVVPGRLTDPMSRGCNRLLGQGASVLFDIEETMTEIMQNKCCGTNPESGGMTEKRIKLDRTKNPYDEKSLRYAIYSVLDVEPKSIQQIYEEVYNKMPKKGCSVSALQAELLFMQMERNAEEKNGRFFRTLNTE